MVERFQTELLDVGGPRGPLARTTVWSYVKAVRGFIDWMRNEGEEVQAKVRLPRQEHKVIEVLERDEIDRLEAASDSERDKLIVRVLADTGMRVGELVKLRDSDFGVQDRRRHYLKVRGKGSRERLVPIDAMLAGRLNRYMTRTRPADTDTDRLFLSRRRTAGGAYQPITESGVQQMVRDVAERAGIRKRVHPHLFRHSAATYMLQRGMNPLSVAHVLGHTNLAMIERVYAHLTFRDDHRGSLRLSDHSPMVVEELMDALAELAVLARGRSDEELDRVVLQQRELMARVLRRSRWRLRTPEEARLPATKEAQVTAEQMNMVDGSLDEDVRRRRIAREGAEVREEARAEDDGPDD